MGKDVDVIPEFIDPWVEQYLISCFDDFTNRSYCEGSLGQEHAARFESICHLFPEMRDFCLGNLEERVTKASGMYYAEAQWMVSYDPFSHLEHHQDGDFERSRGEFATAILNLNNEVDTFDWGTNHIHLKPRDLIIGDGYNEHGFNQGAIVDTAKKRYAILFREG